MEKQNYILTVFIALIFISCDNELKEDKVRPSSDLELQENFSLLDWSPNVYHDYFVQSSREVGISSLKANPFSEESVVNLFDERTMAKSDLIYKINGDQFSSSAKSPGVDMKSLYGTNVNFTIEKRSGASFKDGSSSKGVDMYVPHLISILKPEIKGPDELLPHCYSKNLVLEWNADPKNNEGLMIAAEYVGMSANPNMDKPEHIINTDFIKEDNGRWVIGEDLWAGIPDTGIVYLILLRGNVDLQEIDGELNKFFAETHSIATIILIKDLDSVE